MKKLIIAAMVVVNLNADMCMFYIKDFTKNIVVMGQAIEFRDDDKVRSSYKDGKDTFYRELRYCDLSIHPRIKKNFNLFKAKYDNYFK